MSVSFGRLQKSASNSLIRTAHRFLAAYGVGLVYIDPKDQTHHSLSSVGYPSWMVKFLATEFWKWDSYQEAELSPELLLSWKDFPGLRESAQAQHWLRPQGIDEGTSMILRTPGGNRGVLHVSLERAGFPSDGLHLLEALRPEFDTILDSVVIDERLSSRERQVLELVAAGATNNAISSRLDISIYTVRTHLENIFKKMEVSSRTEAAINAEMYLGEMKSAS